MQRLGSKRWLGTLAICLVLVAKFVSSQYAAGDNPPDAKPKADSPRVAQNPQSPATRAKITAAAPAKISTAAPKPDPYAVPTGDVNTLGEFIGKVQDLEAPANTEAAQELHAKRVYAAVAEAAQRILRHPQADEDQALAGARTALQAFAQLHALGDETAAARSNQLVETLRKDKRPGIVDLVAQYGLLKRLMAWERSSATDKTTFARDVKQYLASTQVSEDHLQLAMAIGETMEQTKDYPLAAEVYETLLDKLPADGSYQEVADRLNGYVRRLRLPGRPMELTGELIGGQKLDWESYRGKVVLVDFWATWCGPCIGELPNVVENYRRYHAQGFEVIGISLDDDRQQVESFVKSRKLAWPIIFHADEAARGWQQPMVVHYGINGIPAAILVDQAGNVVSLDARGPELGKLLKKLLKDAPAAKQAKADTKSAG